MWHARESLCRFGRFVNGDPDAAWICAVREAAGRPAAQPQSDVLALPVEVLPTIFVGNKFCVGDVRRLQALGVTHVLNMAGAAGEQPPIVARQLDAAGIEVLHLAAEDAEGYPLLPRHFAPAHAFIEAARTAGGRCLVHCQAGINRSVTVLTAAFMLQERIDLVEAVRRVRAARGRPILSNRSFVRQLVQLAREHGRLDAAPAERPPAGADVPRCTAPVAVCTAAAAPTA
jgi:predicted protein tyrosine phosphatase